jgi:alpha-D-xyloside xylohydrolase
MPEVRIAASVEDLIRRLQTVLFSPLAQVDGWFIKNPPWKQVNRDLNNTGQLDPNWEETEARCRRLMELRMRLVPYLHAAFVRYLKEGLPPFRALVMDYPDDPQTWTLDNQYLMGERLLVAPVVAGASGREVYLPEGGWFDFWSGKRYAGRQRIQVAAPLEQIPLYIKDGTLLPLAEPTQHTDDPNSWKLTVMVYGDGTHAATLYEEDGGFEPPLTAIRLTWDAARRAGAMTRTGPQTKCQYQIRTWEVVG